MKTRMAPDDLDAGEQAAAFQPGAGARSEAVREP
jgi:hypothetical protein